MNSISRKNCYIVSAGDLQNRYSCQEESGKRMTPGLLIGCHVDTSTGLVSFTVNGQEAANKFQVTRLFCHVFHLKFFIVCIFGSYCSIKMVFTFCFFFFLLFYYYVIYYYFPQRSFLLISNNVSETSQNTLFSIIGILCRPLATYYPAPQIQLLDFGAL